MTRPACAFVTAPELSRYELSAEHPFKPLRLELTRTLAAEVEGVGVLSVDPGDMRTAMHQDAFPGEDITDRPTPDVTLPFWAWLLGQDPLSVSGARFEAQGERWEVPVEEHND